MLSSNSGNAEAQQDHQPAAYEYEQHNIRQIGGCICIMGGYEDAALSSHKGSIQKRSTTYLGMAITGSTVPAFSLDH